jgi:hypothetical protein
LGSPIRDGNCQKDVEVVKGSEERGDPYQAPHQKRDADRHLSEGDQVAKEVGMGDHHAGDEGPVPREWILDDSFRQFLRQDMTVQKWAGNFWPRGCNEVVTHNDANDRQITKIRRLLEIGRERHIDL